MQRVKRIPKTLPPWPCDGFLVMQKVSLCGNQIKRDAVKGLTLAECSDESRFPLGPQKDSRGTYIWQRSVEGD